MALTRGARLRLLRTQAGQSVRGAAAAIGIAHPYLSLLEQDKKGSNVDHIRGTMERLAKHYGVRPEYLLAETPQAYIAALVNSLDLENPDLATPGKRLRLVLTELNRWDGSSTAESLADGLGISVEMLMAYLHDAAPLSKETAEHLSALTGAPVALLAPHLTTTPEEAASSAVKRVINLALESGISAKELEKVIGEWKKSVKQKEERPSVS